MKRKISAIIISIILSIVGIIPTMSITYAVSNDTVTENCIYRTSVKHKGVSKPDYWSFVSTLVAYDNGHIRIDVQCVTCGGFTCNEIGSIQFSDNMIAPVGTTGYGGISTFKPTDLDSKYFTSYATQDIIYTLTYSDSDYHLSGVTLMSFDLYVKEPYLNTNQKIIFFGNEIEIPFEKESVKIPTETTTTTTTTTTSTTTTTTTTTIPTMRWEVNNVQACPGQDVHVEVKVINSVALKSIENLTLTVDGIISIKSLTLNIAGTCDYTISGNQITFSFADLGTLPDGGTLFTVTYHVEENCKPGYYRVYWNTAYVTAQCVDNSKCHVSMDYGYICVFSNRPSSFPTATTTTATTTTTITTANSEVSSPTKKYALGDVNNDGTVDGSDATIVLREFGQVLAGKPAQFTDAQFAAGDVDKNGVIDGSDATLILKFYGEAGKDIEVSYGGMELWLQSWHYRNENTN